MVIPFWDIKLVILTYFFYYIKIYYTGIILGYHKIGGKRAFSGRAKKRVIPLLPIIIY
jgi:hypothetical protein